MPQQKTIINTQPPQGASSFSSPQFKKRDFDSVEWRRGYEIAYEKALPCPCKSPSTNQQSNCQNCGGSGWSFINPLRTRGIITGMNHNTEFKKWSQEDRGYANISMMDRENVCFMDRITVLDAESNFAEVRHIKKFDPGSGDKLFVYTSYQIKSIFYVGLFEGETVKYKQLILDTDYTFELNRLIVDDSYLAQFTAANDDLSIVVRYKHAPEYYVVDFNRDTMNQFKLTGKFEETEKYPISCVGRRAHYILDADNFNYTRILNNSFDEPEID